METIKIIPTTIAAVYRYIKPLPLPDIEIETTSVCTRKCSYCPNSFMQRTDGFMEEKTFYKIIDSLEKIGFKERISPHFYGEPLCDNRLEKFMRYTKDKLPYCKIKLFTNGDLLTFERFESLKNPGVDIFRISKHDKDLSENIIKLKNKYQNLISIDDYYAGKALLMNRGGILNNIPKRTDKKVCFINQITIDYLGNVLACNNDYLSSIIFGNVNHEDIKTIWYRHRFRRAFIMRGLWLYPICKKC